MLWIAKHGKKRFTAKTRHELIAKLFNLPEIYPDVRTMTRLLPFTSLRGRGLIELLHKNPQGLTQSQVNDMQPYWGVTEVAESINARIMESGYYIGCTRRTHIPGVESAHPFVYQLLPVSVEGV